MTGSALSVVREPAPAKINLALHVTGRRADGYHLLESLVAFTAYGDEVEVSAADADSFTIDGPFSRDVPTDGGNLVLRARDALRLAFPSPLLSALGGEAREDRGGDDHPGRPLRGDAASPSPLRGGGVSIRLTKNLPIASGIGGGSSDAAATLRALNRLWGANLTDSRLMEIAAPLGADLPMCLVAKPLIARGIGERIEPVRLPEIPMVLVNPGVAVSTPDVFRALAASQPSHLQEGSDTEAAALPPLPSPLTLDALLAWLPATRNDLQGPAISIAPPVAHALAALEGSGSVLARMSGSGATCFGLFRRQSEALSAAMAIRAARPGWFVVATHAMA